MNYKRFATSSVCAVCAMLVMAAPALANDDDEVFVVVKARRVITVSGEEYSPGTIVIVDGKVRLVGGSGLEYPGSAKVIDAKSETVMPGLIHPRSRFQLPTYPRKGIHGDLRAKDEVYLKQIPFEDLLQAGYTAVCFYPSGTGAPGVASVYRTAGEDDARHLLDDSYLRITMTDAGRDKKVLRGALEKAKKEIEKVEKAREAWDKKQKEKAEEKKEAEKQKKPEDKKPNGVASPLVGGEGSPTTTDVVTSAEADKPGKVKPDAKAPPKPEVFKAPKIDPAHQPFIDLIEGSADVPALIELRRASDLRHTDDVLKPYEDIAIQYYLMPGRSADFHHVIEDLGEREARVLVSPSITYLPLTVIRYNLAAELARAKCEVVFVPWADTRAEFQRIRSRLADLVRAGLDRSDALKGLTLNAARAVGLGDRLGSIEKGKDADLVFFRGDPLSPHTKPTRVMILGEIVWKAEDRR